MRLFIFDYIDHDEDDFSIPDHLLALIQDNLKHQFFPASGLDMLKPEHELYLTLAVRDELMVKGPTYGKKRYKWFLAFPYNKLATAKNFNKTYAEFFFAAFAKVATHYKLDLAVLEQTKETVLKELKAHPEKYQLTEDERSNLDWIRKMRAKYKNELDSQ